MASSSVPQAAPVRAFPGIPTPDGRIPSVEEQLSEKRRLRSEMRKNSNPPLATNAYFNSTGNSSSRRSSPSPVRTAAGADPTNTTGSSTGGRMSSEQRNTSADSFGNLVMKHKRGSSSNDMSAMNSSVRSDKAPRMVWQNQHEGDDNGSDDDEDGTSTPFLSMRSRQHSVDAVIASVPGARRPTSRDRENPPPMYIRNTTSPTTTPARSSTSPPQPRSPQ